mmetsp:Transcript_7323/g.19062  ORF Transcript_7323/g.19062 Transcript_7323/m.19062 type:complete len:149 (-) Transcript_7323:1-447(-)
MLINELTEEGACALVAVAEFKPNQIKSPCGIGADATAVDFSEQGLDAADAVLLASELRTNATMTGLNLRGNEFYCESAQHIAEALKVTRRSPSWTSARITSAWLARSTSLRPSRSTRRSPDWASATTAVSFSLPPKNYSGRPGGTGPA